MAIARKAGALGASVAVAGGLLVAGAGAASAANKPILSGPSSAKAGQTFLLNCSVKGKKWQGGDAHALEQNASVNAHRVVASNGDCSMHLVLNAKGARKIRVVVDTDSGATTQSKWFKINIQ